MSFRMSESSVTYRAEWRGKKKGTNQRTANEPAFVLPTHPAMDHRRFDNTHEFSPLTVRLTGRVRILLGFVAACKRPAAPDNRAAGADFVAPVLLI